MKHTRSTKFILKLQKILSKTFSGIKELKKLREEKWGDMYLLCNLKCSLNFCCFPLFDWETCMEWNKISFSKHYDILSIFKWIFCTLEITENPPVLGILPNYSMRSRKNLMKVSFFFCISRHNKTYIKVSGNSVENFLDTHPPLNWTGTSAG